jgi:Cu/Ag efflux protein CusF
MKIVIPVFVAAASLLATMAFAANMSASGVIKSVSTKGDSITLVDGSVYILKEGSEAEDFKAGEKVAIVFVKTNGKMMASSVKIMK